MAAPAANRAVARPRVAAPAPRLTRPVPERPRLRVVDDTRLRAERRQGRFRAVVMVGFVAAAGMLFAVAACHAFLVSGQSRVDALQREVAAEQARYSARRLDIDRLEAPDRIVREANERLGMRAPDSVTYLTPSSETAQAVGALDSSTSPSGGATASGRGWADVKRALGTRP